MGQRIKGFIKNMYNEAEQNEIAKQEAIKKKFAKEKILKKKPGRPRKLKEDLARKYDVRIKKEFAKVFEVFGGKGDSGSKKLENLILKYLSLQNALAPQIESVQAIIEAARKIFDAMAVNEIEFRSKSQQPVLIESRQEVDLMTKILEKKQELLTMVRIFGFEDEFIKTQLTKKDFEFYYWFKNRS